MKYTVTLFNKFRRPYIYGKKDTKCINTDYSSYETEDRSLFKQMIKDLLDVPIAELSLEEIKEQFSSHPYDRDISEEKLVAIQNFYNGRFALCRTIMETLDSHNFKYDEVLKLQYDIPYEYNHFVVEDNDEFDEEQIEAYISLEIKNV
jgi:hypothetical protein